MSKRAVMMVATWLSLGLLVPVFIGCGGGGGTGTTLSSTPTSTAGSTPPALVTAPPAPDTEKPTAPTAVTATAAGPLQITVSWAASTDNIGVTGYTVSRDGTLITTTTARTYIDILTVTSTSPRTYSVVAFDAAGNSSTAGTASATAADVTAPTAPAGLTATPVSTTQINLQWAPSSDPVTGGGASGVASYQVFRGSTSIATPTGTFYNDTAASAGANTYTVVAVDGAGNRSPSVGVTGAATVTGTAADSTGPTAAIFLSAAAVSTTGINLAWSAATDTGGAGLASYRITRDGATTPIAFVTAATTSYSDTTTAGLHSYTVTPIDGAGNAGTKSNTASATAADVTAPSAVTGLSQTLSALASITITWTVSTDTGGAGLASHEVFRNGTLVSSVGPTATTFADTGLAAGKTFTYAVVGVDGAGNRSSSTVLAANTSAPAASATVQAPTITNVVPGNGGVGITVTITGTNLQSVVRVWFTGSSTAVTAPAGIGVVPGTITGTTSLTVTVPAGAQDGLLALEVSGKDFANTAARFLAQPIVAGFTPNIARPGNVITILGSNFCGATSISFNGLASTPTSANTCSGANNLQNANILVSTTLLSTVTGAVVSVTVTTPNATSAFAGQGTYATAATCTAVPLVCPNTRIALLTSFRPATGNDFPPPRAMAQLGSVMILGSVGALYSMDLAGNFLGSVGLRAPGAGVTTGATGLRSEAVGIATHGAMSSVYVTTLDSYIYVWNPYANTTAFGGISAVNVLVSAGGSAAQGGGMANAQLGPIVAATGATAPQNSALESMVWTVDTTGGATGGGLGSLFSTSPGPVGPTALLSLEVVNATALGSVTSMAFSSGAMLRSIWAVTRLGSVMVVSNPFGTSPTATVTAPSVRSYTILPFTANSTAYITQNLTSLWVAGGTTIAILASVSSTGFQGVSLPGQGVLLASLFLGGPAAISPSNAALASWGRTPLVSVLAFDTSNNLWYADGGQKAIVRCAVGSNCAASSLVSFGLTGTPGNAEANGATTGSAAAATTAGARILVIDSLGSLWFDAVSPGTGGGAVERLIP